MGKLRGFIEYNRIDEANIPVADRVKNYKEFTVNPGVEKLQDQGARCMDCGVPFCHSGCPLGNMIPDFNDARILLSKCPSSLPNMYSHWLYEKNC